MNINYHTLSVAWKEIQLMSRIAARWRCSFLLPLLLGALIGGINCMANSGEGPIISVARRPG